MKTLALLILSLIPAVADATSYRWNVDAGTMNGKFYELLPGDVNANLYGFVNEAGTVTWHNGTLYFNIPLEVSLHDSDFTNPEMNLSGAEFLNGTALLSGQTANMVSFDTSSGFLEAVDVVGALTFASGERFDLDYGNWGRLPGELELRIDNNYLETTFLSWPNDGFADGYAAVAANYQGEIPNPEPLSIILLGAGLVGLRCRKNGEASEDCIDR